MIAIITKWVPCSNVRGARYIADNGDGCRGILSSDDALNAEQNHEAAVRKLCSKMGWHGTLAKGYLHQGGKMAGRVWVWIDNGRKTNPADVIEV